MNGYSPFTPIVFIPGLGSSHRAFASLIDELRLPYETYTTFDYAGFRDRPAATHIGDALRYAADEVVNHARAHGFERFHLVGHSMGGTVALMVAHAHRELVEGLISIEGNMTVSDGGLISRAIAASETVEQVEKIKNDTVAAAKLSSLPGMQLWSVDLAAVSAQLIYDYSESLVGHTDQSAIQLETFNGLTCPRVYIFGDNYTHGKNASLPPRLSEGTGFYVEGASHFVMQDRPKQTAEIIRRVLRL